MDETYWKQFVATGKIEDYLQFKGVSNIRENNEKNSENMIHKQREERDLDFLK